MAKILFKIIKKSSLIISLFFLFNLVKTQEEDEEILEYYIHFDLNETDIKSREIKDIISKSNSIKIPDIQLNKEDYFFSGWTADGVYGYEPGDISYRQSGMHQAIQSKPTLRHKVNSRTFHLTH